MIPLPILESGNMCCDAMIEVFMKSPMESVRRFCFVSKNWGNFLSHPTFNQLHSRRNPRNPVLAFPVKDKKLAFLKKTKPPIPDSCFSIQRLPMETHDMILVGSCEGLLAFSFESGKNHAFVWNPTTKAGKLFNLPPLSKHEVYRVSTGLGFDMEKDDFQFIRLVNFLDSRGTVVQAYSFSQDSWKEFPRVSFVPSSPNCQFVIKGVPHWVGNDDSRSLVFHFNPATEEYRLFPFPVVDKSRSVFVISVKDAMGALSISEPDFNLDFYSFDAETWVKMYNIGPLQTEFDIKHIRKMQIFESAAIVWGLPWDTCFHDVAENQSLPVSVLVHNLSPKMDESYSHLETLVTVHGSNSFYPRSVGEVFRDFKARRASLIRALTTDVDKFDMECCKAGEKCHCLHGFPHDEWKVNVHGVHSDELAELPEPVRGINLARNVMEKNEWLSFVARRSDDWLLSVAFFFAAQFEFNKADRLRLFTLMNDLPTVSEVVTGTIRKHLKDVPALMKPPKSVQLKEEVEEGLQDADDEHGGDLICGACGENYRHNGLFIRCDSCKKVFHQNCLKNTLSAEQIKQSKCLTCSNKRARP